MYFKTTEFNNTPEFLASQHYINFTKTASDEDIIPDENGKKYVLAGNILGESGKIVKITGSTMSEEPCGITFNTVDVTYGPQPVAVMVEGYVLIDRLPIENVSQALEQVKEKLPNIKFM